MSMREELQRRWRPEFEKHPVAKAARKHLDAALKVIADLEAKRSDLVKNKNLSDFGRADEMRVTAKALAPTVAKALGVVSAATVEVEKLSQGRVPVIKDKSDVAAQLTRREIRDRLNTMNPAQVIQAVTAPNVDPTVLEAIFESRFLLPHLTDEHMGHIRESLADRLPEPAKRAIAEQTDAIEVLETAVHAAAGALRAAAGVPEQGFNAWLQETAPTDAATAAAQFNSETVTQTALSLPYHARKKLIDVLLATGTAEILKGAA